MGQDPKDLTNVWCDGCGHRFAPKEKFVRLKTETLWSMAGVGLGVFICQGCLCSKLGIGAEAFNPPTMQPETPNA